MHSAFHIFTSQILARLWSFEWWHLRRFVTFGPFQPSRPARPRASAGTQCRRDSPSCRTCYQPNYFDVQRRSPGSAACLQSGSAKRWWWSPTLLLRSWLPLIHRHRRGTWSYCFARQIAYHQMYPASKASATLLYHCWASSQMTTSGSDSMCSWAHDNFQGRYLLHYPQL